MRSYPDFLNAVCISIVSHENDALIEFLLNDLESYSHIFIKKIILTHNTPHYWLTPSKMTPALREKMHIVYNAAPKGFGENHNHAFTYCNTGYFCVLNPDIRLKEDPFEPLLKTLTLHSSIGVIAPEILDTQEQRQDNARKFLTFSEGFKRLFFRSPPTLSSPYPDWVAGMFMLFNTQAFREISGFDTGYFLYAEDMDICARLKLKGQSVYFEKNAMAFHNAQRKSHQKLKYFLWHVKSLFRFFYKYYGFFRRALKKSALY